MATPTSTTTIWNSQNIEAEYYHNIIHQGLERTHSLLTLGGISFSVEVCQVSAAPMFNPIATIEGVDSNLTQTRPIPFEPYQRINQSKTYDLTQTYKSVLNSPAVRKNALSFEAFHSSHQIVPFSCQDICELTTQVTSKISESLIPSKSELEESYIQSILLRGIEATHRSFHIYGYHVRLVVNDNGALSVTCISSNQSSENIQIGFITRLEQIVEEQLIQSKRILAEEKHRKYFNKEQSSTVPNEGMLCTQCIAEVANGIATDVMTTLRAHGIESGTPYDTQPEAQTSEGHQATTQLLSEYISSFAMIGPELERTLTIEYTAEGARTSQRQTRKLYDFLNSIQICIETDPNTALQITREIKKQLTAEVYDLLRLNHVEEQLVHLFENKIKVQTITDKINELPCIKKHQITDDAECCILLTPFEETDEIIEIRTGKNPESWRLISKKTVMGVLGSDNPISNPFDRSELSSDDFRPVLLNP
ncbi:MAG: hypothetical protein HAW66_00095 [Shewanella sp.]|nr:hypothetical protein [Shewanella sp.]